MSFKSELTDNEASGSEESSRRKSENQEEISSKLAKLAVNSSNDTLQRILAKVGQNEAGNDRADSSKNIDRYKFWKTQPVPRFDEENEGETDGPIQWINRDDVPQKPNSLLEGFMWVTMDLDDVKQIEEIYELLANHYVEDDDCMFRFNYSKEFLNWALKGPGWLKDWHVGVRVEKSGRLVAFISGIPVRLRVRDREIKCSEINFLCVHKKLRRNRLTPVLIKEITRRCYVDGTYQAIYTAGVLLPAPISICRYFHRCLNWRKLYEVGFSALPRGSTVERQVLRHKVPKQTRIMGLRSMREDDVDQVLDLLTRYLNRMMLAQKFTREEVKHWFINADETESECGDRNRVIWSYVVESGGAMGRRITDFFSFYSLESTVIGNSKHTKLRAAYLFYYATEAAFVNDGKDLKGRLNELMRDALVLAKQENFDVFNALTLMDNPLFLSEQLFGPGDGRLHFYLYNYRTAKIPGGIDGDDKVDITKMKGVGMVML